jgi:hypothetical protein
MAVATSLLCIHRDPAQLTVLQENGFSLITAIHGRQGLRLLVSKPVDAIILESKEIVGWQAWKDHDAKQAVAWLTNDPISIADGGVFKGKEQVVKSVADARCVVNSFSLSDFSYMWLDKDTVVMTYTGTQDATCDGKKQGGKVFATSIWQKKSGKWLSPFHQETEAGGM